MLFVTDSVMMTPDTCRSVLFADMEEFRLLVTDNGRLQLNVLVYSTQRDEQTMTYTDSFCFDATNKIVVFCPCTKLPCVRKCCYDGSIYNVSVRQCVDTGYDDVGFWRPNFQVGKSSGKHGKNEEQSGQTRMMQSFIIGTFRKISIWRKLGQ